MKLGHDGEKENVTLFKVRILCICSASLELQSTAFALGACWTTFSTSCQASTGALEPHSPAHLFRLHTRDTPHPFLADCRVMGVTPQTPGPPIPD